ncbi:MAG: sugar ABC transporter substrate-binding protein [Methylomonas sp.]|nr:sugar ABC transporter substrate-binding protein [Methylomonas sp.]
MNRKIFWTFFVVLIITSMLLSACQPAAPDQPEPPPVEQPVEEEITLRWRTRPENQAEIDVYSSISQEIDNQLEGVKLVYEPGGAETASYQDVLKTELGAGTAPDVFWIPGTDVADFVQRGLILDISPFAAGFDSAAFYPGPMFHLTFNPETGGNDKLWGLPRDVSTFALYLNLDLIREAGAPDPRQLAKEGNWDWDAFLDVAQKVTALGGGVYGYGANAWWGPYGVWINAAGGGFFNEDRTACALDTPEAIQGLSFQQSLYVEHKVAVPYGEDSEPPFMAGKVAMFQNGRWATPGMRANAKFDWDVVEMPQGPDGPGNWLFWGAYVVNANTAQPGKAWELVHALTTAETQAKIAALGTNIPSRVSQEALDAFLTFTPPQNNQAFLNGISEQNKPTAEGPLWAGNWPDFDRIMGAKVNGILTGQMSIEDFQASICAEADKAFTP